MKTAQLLAHAANVLQQFLQTQQPLSECWQSDEEPPRVRALVLGVLRHYWGLETILQKLLQRPFKKKDACLQTLLLLGIFQLAETPESAHATINESVNACESLNRGWAKKLVNAILRRYQREENQWPKPQTEENHPDWFKQRVRAAWPEQASAILSANNQPPPFAIHVNPAQYSQEAYQEKLKAAELSSTPIPQTDRGLIVKPAVSVHTLPNFAEGACFVQDGAAQLVTQLLNLQPGQRFLDACAAPGGKTLACLLEEPELSEVWALDSKASRLDLVKSNLTRLNLSAELRCCEAQQLESWWDQKPFDRILLDAPCSATGIIRRHPDIKHQRQPEHVDAITETQLSLLSALWQCLNKTGLMVYATCSVLKEENDDVIARFLEATPTACVQKPSVSWGIETEHGHQILPGNDEMDGFFYCCLVHKDLP